ncbi:MAG: hypothetical protein M5R40_04390 [Anaerolineae bacterium]|nr:hypothetical protein [Anaerolineae bacterium]
MGKANALYELQSLDLEIGAKKARLSDVNGALGDERPVQKAQAQLAKIEADLRPLQTRHTDLELEIKTLETKARTAEDRLYSGAVTNPKELQDMQSEVASLKRRRAALEDQLLEVMIQVEEQTAARKKAAARLEKDEAALGRRPDKPANRAADARSGAGVIRRRKGDRVGRARRGEPGGLRRTVGADAGPPCGGAQRRRGVQPLRRDAKQRRRTAGAARRRTGEMQRMWPHPGCG